MPTTNGSYIDGHDADLNERDANSQTPLLTPSLPKSTSVPKRFALLFQNWWLWEILSASTAVLTIIVIICILFVYDQRSLPDWPSIFTV